MHEQGDIPRRSFLIEHRAAESSQADDPQPRPVLLNQRATETNPSGVQELSSLSSCYDPMAYPLLFPFGDHGWSRLMEQRGRGQIGSKVTIRDFYAFRIMDRTSVSDIDTVDTVATDLTEIGAAEHELSSSGGPLESSTIADSVSNVSQTDTLSTPTRVVAANVNMIAPAAPSNAQLPDTNVPNAFNRFNLLHHACKIQHGYELLCNLALATVY